MTKVTHVRKNFSLSGEALDSPAVFLRNPNTWFSQYADSRQSRYEGWYFIDTTTLPHSMIKVLDRVQLARHLDGQPDALRVTRDQAVFTYGENHLSVTLAGRAGMTIWSTGPGIVLSFDIRGSYQHPSLGRQFRFSADTDGSLIGYTDAELGKLVYVYVLGALIDENDGRWIETSHPRDKARHSEPHSGWVFEFTTTSTQISLGVALSPEAAKRNAHESLNMSVQIPSETIEVDEQTMTTLCAIDTLESLRAPGGYYAGLPWFHQFWTRDELIAGLGLGPDEQLAMIEQYITLPLDRGQLPTFLGSGTSCADGLGWLLLLAKTFGFSQLPTDTLNELVNFTKNAVAELQQYRKGKNGLIASEHNATWMDTIGRSGYRIEIQSMYALALELVQSEEREKFIASVREEFFREGQLLDGFSVDGAPDQDLRPNIFLAYLFSPDLLSKAQWEICFTNALPQLLTPQHGLSSVSLDAAQHQPESTGQDNISYHQGDEWFFINGLAAKALQDFSSSEILTRSAQALVARGRQETLWQHFLGCVGEIASSTSGASWGCGIQAFSAGAWLLASKKSDA